MGKNLLEHLRHSIDMDDEHDEAADEVDTGHQGHDALRNLNEPLETTADDEKHQGCDEDRRYADGQPEGFFHDLGDGIRLNERGPAVLDEQEDGHNGTGMAPAKALDDIVHGTAGDISLAVVAVIAHTEDDFAKFRGHAEKSSEHIQNKAPSPPDKIAVETPTIFPLPTQLARNPHSDCHEEQPFSPCFLR